MLNIVEVGVRYDLREEIKKRIDQLKTYITQCSSILDHFPSSFLETLEWSGGKLHASILRPILNEHMEFVNKTSTSSSSIISPSEMGPLSLLLDKLNYYSNNLYSINTLSYDEHRSKTLTTSITEIKSPSFPTYFKPQINTSYLRTDEELPKKEKLVVNYRKITGSWDNLLISIENPSVSQYKWSDYFRGVRSYKIKYAEKINPHSLMEMLRAASQNKVEEITFSKCHFDVQCCNVLEDHDSSIEVNITVKLKQCKTQVPIRNQFIEKIQ